MNAQFNRKQTEQMLRPVNPVRVLKDGKGMSHLSQQDVLAMLIRVFGFGHFDFHVISNDLVFETCHGDPADPKARWTVGYRAAMALDVRNPDGEHVCHYEDASIGSAQNLVRQDAHDLAMKSAISLARKRCCIALGDGWGLSLYNKGQTSALVKGTLVMPEEDEPVDAVDVQEGVDQQVSLGVDETEHPMPEATDEQEEMLASALGAQRVEEPAPQEQERSAEQAPITDAQSRKMGVLMKALNITTREDALATVTGIVKREVSSRNDLTKDEASLVLDALDAQMKKAADQ